MSSSYSAYISEAMAPRQAPPRKSRRFPWTALPLLVALIAVAMCVWVHVHQSRAREHARFVAQLTDNPALLDAAVATGQVDRFEGRRAVMQPIRDEARQRMQAYFALPPGEARQRYLDQLIDEIQEVRSVVGDPGPGQGPGRSRGSGQAGGGAAGAAQGGGAGAGQGGGAAGGSANNNRAANDRTARMENIPPEDRAQFQQMRLDMSNRMQQRGIQPPSFMGR